MADEETPGTWRCLLDDCPTRGRWQSSEGSLSPEQAWTGHMYAEHGWIAS